MHVERRILLVEDDEADRTIMLRTLREAAADYAVTTAGTGADALERLEAQAFDCVLLDYYLPDMDGRQFLGRMRATDAGRDVPVAMLTGRDNADMAAESLKLGAQDYVVKGTVNGAGMVRVIENAIEKFAIRRELEEKRAAVELRTWELEMVRDELQERVAQLTHATRAKDQFVAVMSHEMRTPLNAILGYTDLMDLGVGGKLTDGQRSNVERIRAGGQHLLELINNVLDLSRADAREVEMSMRPVDVVVLTEEVLALLESQAELVGIELSMEVPEEALPAASADLQRLRQVLINIVGNALKFTDEGHVRVRFDADAEHVSIRVEDTGIGIAPENLELVFGEFFQADGALTRRHGGSGLGLAIAERFIHLMGGEIHVDSRLGDGSTFTITLPRSSEVPQPVAAAALESPVERWARDERPTGSGRRTEKEKATAADEPVGDDDTRVVVLAFGRNEERLDQLRERVSSQVRLICTTDPDSVPGLAAQERPSLVVLDITGGDGGAWRAAHALQEIVELMHIAVLLLPGIPEPTESEDGVALDLGWVSLVPKPFNASQLTSAVSRAARTRTPALETDSGAPVDVLIVDDDADSRRVAAKFLDSAGARIREATGGEQALVMMRQRAPDVLVLDLMMPVLDGFGVLATMRADPALAGIPVVVLSAKTLSEEERRFLSKAAVRVLQKGAHRFGDVAALVMRAAARASDHE